MSYHAVGFTKNFESTAVLIQFNWNRKWRKFSWVNVCCEDLVLACQSLKKNMFKFIWLQLNVKFLRNLFWVTNGYTLPFIACHLAFVWVHLLIGLEMETASRWSRILAQNRSYRSNRNYYSKFPSKFHYCQWQQSSLD